MRIKIKAVKQYGAWVFYPESREARLFAKIAGTRTLTSFVISLIKEMGVEVEVQYETPAIHAGLEQ